jgi:hypothetical protein
VPLEEVYNKYSSIATNHIVIDRFSRILNKQYEIKRSRGLQGDNKSISRIVGYKIKEIIEDVES